MDIKNLRLSIGKVLHMYPTGNAEERGKRWQEPVEMTLMDVARVNVTVVERMGCQRKYRFREQDGQIRFSCPDGNYGYVVFGSKQDFDDYVKSLKLRSCLRRELPLLIDHSSLQDLERVADIFNLENIE